MMGREPAPKPGRILYIGRVDTAQDSLWQQLQREGIEVIFTPTQKAGLERSAEIQPQLIIVNACNAQFSAVRACRALARRLPNIRRLVLLDHKPHEDLQCDLNLIRPFTLQKLRRSILALLDDSAPHMICAGPLQLDIVGKTVVGPAGEHHLTPKQCSLLAIFMERPNQVISRKDLMDQVWDTEYLGDTRTLDVHIRWLREKIEVNPKQPMLLVTRRGVGYALAVDVEVGVESAAPDEVLEVD